MSSYTEIVAFIDAVKSRLSTNAAALTPTGMSNITIYERDDAPFKIADGTMELPIMFVIPLADAADDVEMQWNTGSLEHDFNFSVMCYYEAAIPDLNSSAGQAQRRLILKSLLDLVDLFKGSGAFLASGNIYKATLEIGYFDDKSVVVAGGIVTFSTKLFTA
jgi:hypothetical protein